jgi:hypothetical protein
MPYFDARKVVTHRVAYLIQLGHEISFENGVYEVVDSYVTLYDSKFEETLSVKRLRLCEHFCKGVGSACAVI